MISLFDAQCGFGGGTPGTTDIVSAGDCADTLARLSIDRALVRIAPDTLEHDVVAGNARLFAACTAHPALIPCPLVVPNSGHAFPDEEAQVAEALAHGAGAVSIRPVPDGWLLEPWACDRLFRVLEAYALPVLCLERLVSLTQVAGLAGRYPALPLIVAETNYRAQRTLLPLLETFPNVFLSIGNNYSLHGGIEQCVELLGPERVLFGTGFPASEPMAAVTQLLYAGISEAEQRMIGVENMQRLLAGVRR